MRKVILYIAMSLDGYIADKNGSVNWLEGENAVSQELGSYDEFIKTIDTVILGWNTYNQIITELSPEDWVYKCLKSYVISHRKMESTEEVTFTNENIEALINRLKAEEGKDIWICGGASIVNQLIKTDLIDKYIITIIPTILGNGIKLFKSNLPEIKLKLISTKSYNGMTDLVYERRL